MATLSDSNGVYMNEIVLVQGAHYSHFPQQLDNLSQPSSLSNSLWFVDFGATNHITSNLNNLSLHAPYNGGDKVAIGNGKTLPISHVGYNNLYTQ